jgi:electron transfer flavoprotein beta subunit
MKVMVCVKRVVDYNVHIQVKPDGSGIVTEGVKHSMNPFDEIAMEEAVRMKEAGTVSEIVAVTIGPVEAEETLRTALAYGADRAIHVRSDAEVQPLTCARTLAVLFEKESPGLMIMGKQAIDDDANQTGQMIAALTGRPQATFASRIEIQGECVRVTREVDMGLEVIEVDLPAIITTDLRLNEPRYLRLPDIMKARKKPIETTSMEALGVEEGPQVRVVKYAQPPSRGRGVMVKSVDELVLLLKEKGFA